MLLHPREMGAKAGEAQSHTNSPGEAPIQRRLGREMKTRPRPADGHPRLHLCRVERREDLGEGPFCLHLIPPGWFGDWVPNAVSLI